MKKTGSDLLGHPIINREKGIEFSTGSLGMGLSLGIGVALAARRLKRSFNTYVVIGDGECNEGSIWESALSAPQFQLGNLVAILDRNGFQQTGSNQEIMSVGDLAAKWRAFGWEVSEVDGHSVRELLEVFSKPRPRDKPLAIVAKTVKGKGVSFAENNNDWHHHILTQANYDIAIKELESQ